MGLTLLFLTVTLLAAVLLTGKSDPSTGKTNVTTRQKQCAGSIYFASGSVIGFSISRNPLTVLETGVLGVPRFSDVRGSGNFGKIVSYLY